MELWQTIKLADAAGHTAYHACAGYKEARLDQKGTPPAQRRYGRTKHNSRCGQSFWFELDAGPNKPYPDWKAAAAALAEFCKATGLPRPLVVLSGFGIHAYWPLVETLDPETWGRYAKGLKALCAKHGLQADPARTADITSVLRTPGTHHRKLGTRLVECGPLVGPYDLTQFAILLSIEPETNKTTPKRSTILDELGPIPPYLKNRRSEPVCPKLDKSFATIFQPSFSIQITENCEQVRALWDRQGNLTEPLWYACLGVLAFAKDGEQFAHEWSSGDARYTAVETQERLDRARQLSGATTCRRFHELNSEICERCSWWGKITSPIVLGRRGSQARCDNFDQEHDNRNETKQQEEKDRTGEQFQQDQKQTGQEGKDKNSSGAKAQSAYPLRWHGEENPNIARNWLVKQLLPETGAGLISGQWGTGKTFVAIDLSLSVMMGTQFAGRAVKRRGGVLFIAAEGASEIPIRLHGTIERKFSDHKGKLPFAWAETYPMLTENGAIETLDQIAKEAATRMQSEFGLPLALIIVDTMSAAAGFKDENSSAEGQVAMNVLNELSRRTGALALACDHFGKMVETGTRGTSAKEASADVVIACLGDRSQEGSVTNLKIAVRKLRSGATGAETKFTLRTVDMGVDEDGEPVTTCVVEWSPVTVAPAPQAARGKGWTKSTTLFRVALVTMLKQHGMVHCPLQDGAIVFAVELDKVREEFNKRYPLEAGDREKQMNKRRQAFKRAREEAESKGLIGGRETEGQFMVWLMRPEEEGVREGHQQFTPEHLLDDLEGLSPSRACAGQQNGVTPA
jgi:hypothetical protein